MKLALLATLLVLVAFAAACAEHVPTRALSPQEDSPHLATPAVPAYVGPPRGRGAMPGVRATRMAAALEAAGLDVANLPPLESLAPGPKQRVMRTFSETLGVPCIGCHSEEGFRADTRRKRVAKRMWNEIVRVLATSAGGAPVYCDSCHEGALFHLDRHDPEAVTRYMSKAMVGGFRRRDGRSHDCTTCHGDPPDFHVTETWKATAAPDITHDEHAPGVLAPQFPTEGPRAPADCGENDEHCPLAAWMRFVVAPAAVSQNADALSRALLDVARFAPDDEGFRRAASVAADAARRGDAAATQETCGACHKTYKAAWRATRRAQRAE
jgi:hypothetical protein